MAVFFVNAKRWQLVDIEMNVTRNKQIELAIFVVVAPGRSGAEATAPHSGFIGYVLKFAVAEVTVERIASVTGHVNIGQPVVVVIGHRNAHSPPFVRQSRADSDVTKVEVSVLMVKSDERIAAFAIALKR